MKCDTDVLIIGGGLAGLSCGLHLLKQGIRVQLIERQNYPKHKVCGEYISNEILSYLQWLDADPHSLHPTQISKLQLSTTSGKLINAQLPLGGFGVSRYSLDNFLAQQFLNKGGEIIRDSATDILYEDDKFLVTTSSGKMYCAKFVVGAYGKREALDQKLARPFIYKKSPWLAVKAHYNGEFPNDTVALHHFKGGYCGVSKVEDNKINICYLVNYESFKQHKDIAAHQQAVLYQNPHLKDIFEQSTMEFEKPLTISQISFQSKECVVQHVLMIGDTAGLIHPLCGNGMSMAVHSAKLVAELLSKHFKSNELSREQLEKRYKKEWAQAFDGRIRTGRFLAKLLQSEKTSSVLLKGLTILPSLLSPIIRLTHGNSLMTSK